MNWYRYCRVHVLVPYNIKLYTALRLTSFDYRVRASVRASRAGAVHSVIEGRVLLHVAVCTATRTMLAQQREGTLVLSP